MGWLEFENAFDGGKSKKTNRKPQRHHDQNDENEEDVSNKEKRSGKRFHRKKTHKEDLLESDYAHNPKKK
jgi:hypothetical protein